MIVFLRDWTSLSKELFLTKRPEKRGPEVTLIISICYWYKNGIFPVTSSRYRTATLRAKSDSSTLALSLRKLSSPSLCSCFLPLVTTEKSWLSLDGSSFYHLCFCWLVFFVRQQIKYPLVLCSSNFLAFFSERFWYCRLSPNLKFLHYGDCQEGEAPPLENLPNKCEYVLQGRGIELYRLLYCPCAALKVFIKKNEIFGQAIFLARLTLPYTMFERFLALKVNPKPKTTSVRQHVWPLRSVSL